MNNEHDSKYKLIQIYVLCVFLLQRLQNDTENKRNSELSDDVYFTLEVSSENFASDENRQWKVEARLSIRLKNHTETKI